MKNFYLLFLGFWVFVALADISFALNTDHLSVGFILAFMALFCAWLNLKIYNDK